MLLERAWVKAEPGLKVSAGHLKSEPDVKIQGCLFWRRFVPTVCTQTSRAALTVYIAGRRIWPSNPKCLGTWVPRYLGTLQYGSCMMILSS